MTQQAVDDDTFEEVFRLFDKNGDGEINVTELGDMMRAFGANPTDEEVREFAVKLDKNGSGKIEKDEIRGALNDIKNKDGDAQLVNAFKVFDLNGDGVIHPAELKVLLSKVLGHTNVSDEEIADMIEAVDKNEDGKIDIKEFASFINTPLSGMSK